MTTVTGCCAVAAALMLLIASGVAVAEARVMPRFHYRERTLARPFTTNLIPCPCENTTLCAPLTTPLPDKEIFAFQVEGENWPRYDWNRLTTVALYDGLDPSMICMAHTRNVRLVWAVTFNKEDLLNHTARQNWLDGIVLQLQNTYTDGVNFDFESPVAASSPEFDALTSLVLELRDRVKAVVPHGSVTFDVAWSTHSVDGRAYNYTAILDICDFVVIMDYDTRSQVFSGPPCYGGPNTPISTAFDGVTSFLQLPGSSVRKLALGVPWYGYNYPCLHVTDVTTDVCQIASVPFRGVACSDAAGAQWGYNTIREFLRQHPNALYTPVDTVLDGRNGSYVTVNINSTVAGLSTPDGLPMSKLYFDDPSTLSQKYVVARDFGLRGVSMWAVDFLEKAPSGPGAQDTRDMWRALDHFVVL